LKQLYDAQQSAPGGILPVGPGGGVPGLGAPPPFYAPLESPLAPPLPPARKRMEAAA